MTTSQTNPEYRRHRRERRQIPPFGDGSAPNSVSNFLDGLLSCRFAPFPSHNPTDEDRYVLAPDEPERPIAPRFEIAASGADRLPDFLNARISDFDLGISVRSRHIRTYRVLAKWPLSEIADAPKKWEPDAAKLEDLQTGRGMDFFISVIVSADRSALAKLGMSLGKVIARKEISIKEPTDSQAFPIDWLEFGVGNNYPKEALWVIEWKDGAAAESESPFAVPVEDALMVYMNKAAEQQLTAISQVAGAERFAWRILASEITAQIWAVVLRETQNEPDEDDADTLAGQVFARLSRISGKPYSELSALADADDRLSELRHLVARLNQVVK